jgi:plastocyanin
MRLRIAAAVVLLVVFAPGSLAADQQIAADPNSASFSPSEVTVGVGETVTVSHVAGSLAHNVHYDDQANGCPISPTTGSWSCPRTFSVAGDYTFHCDLHTSMTGTVHVTSGTTGPTPTPTPTPTPMPNPQTPSPTSSPQAKTVSIGRVARLPKGCAPRRSYRIRLRHPTGLSTAKVFVNGKRVATIRSTKLASRIRVRGLPRGRFTLKVEVTRLDGSRLVGKRRVRTCPASKT